MPSICLFFVVHYKFFRFVGPGTLILYILRLPCRSFLIRYGACRLQEIAYINSVIILGRGREDDILLVSISPFPLVPSVYISVSQMQGT